MDLAKCLYHLIISFKGDSGSGMEDLRNSKRVHLTSVRNIGILNNNMTHDLSKNGETASNIENNIIFDNKLIL